MTYISVRPVHWLVTDDYRWFGHRPTPVDSGKYETEHPPTKSETGRAQPDEIKKTEDSRFYSVGKARFHQMSNGGGGCEDSLPGSGCC